MNIADFLRNFEELLELAPETLTGTETLDELETWDSLAIIGFLAMADDRYGARLTGGRISACESVQDLFELVQSAAVAAA
ncbi:MAG TPA: phosphopantetheine-binding protein [Bryobacteraceae bacterium]|nr:phosphopantetheine-binding protein [Bryobacteraceae bacterium]